MTTASDTSQPETGETSANFEPFPEPNTYPSGWDMESILNPSPPRKPAPQPMPDWYEKFEEPHTFPPGWEQI